MNTTMKKSGLGVLALLALASVACGDDSGGTGGAGGEATGAGGSGGEPSCLGTESDDPQFSQALQVLREAMAEKGVPGGAIAILQDGEVVHVGVAGTKRAGVCDPITPDTLFGVAEMTELLTALAALDAVEEGKLSLTAPITDVIPTLSVDYGDPSEITLNHLLTHTSMYTSGADAEPLESTCTSLAGAFQSAVDPVIQATPGSMQDELDRGNYELAGLALQNVYDMPFIDVVTARVLGPLAMGGGFDAATIDASPRAIGHGDGPVEMPRVDCRNRDPSLGYWGSIDDMAKLVGYLTGGAGSVLEPATLDAALSAQAPQFWSDSYAPHVGPLGWFKSDVGDDLLLAGAANWGFTGYVLRFKNRRLAVITLMNASYGEPSLVAEQIAAIYDPSALAHQSLDYEPVGASLPSLVATYRDDLGASGPRTLEVFIAPGDTGNIAGTLTGEDGIPEPVAFEGAYCADNFSATIGGLPDTYLVRFWGDEATGDGNAIQLIGHNGPPFFRVP